MKYTVKMECFYLGEDKNFEIGFVEDILVPNELSESHDIDCIDVDVEKIIYSKLMEYVLEKFDITYKVLSIKED